VIDLRGWGAVMPRNPRDCDRLNNSVPSRRAVAIHPLCWIAAVRQIRVARKLQSGSIAEITLPQTKKRSFESDKKRDDRVQRTARRTVTPVVCGTISFGAMPFGYCALRVLKDASAATSRRVQSTRRERLWRRIARPAPSALRVLTPGPKAKRITESYRIPADIGIGVNPTPQPNRITLRISSRLRIVIAEVVVVSVGAAMGPRGTYRQSCVVSSRLNKLQNARPLLPRAVYTSARELVRAHVNGSAARTELCLAEYQTSFLRLAYPILPECLPRYVVR
jgi:hypothetical protein